MTVAELIKILENIDPALLVCISDWVENYQSDALLTKDRIIKVDNGTYLILGKGRKKGSYICLG